MIVVRPTTLECHGIRLEPLSAEHRDGLAAAAADGRLWELWYAAVPAPEKTEAYIAAADRVEIGYTFYGKSWQRSHVNTTCKLLLFEHAFEHIGCQVIGLRTDNFNFASQRTRAPPPFLDASPGVAYHYW